MNFTQTFDDNYEEWEVGDSIVWEDDPSANPFELTRIDEYDRVFWIEDGEVCMTRATNMLRVSWE